MQNKTIIGFLAAVLLICGVCYAAWLNYPSHQQVAAVSTALETNKVKIANLPVVQGLPLYVAIDKGYFKDAGIDVEVVKFEAPNQIIDALLQGQVDFSSPSGALGIAGIANYKNPGKLQVYAVAGGTNGHSGVNLILPVNSKLSSVSDLRSKKLGILAGSIQWQTITREILGQNGLNMDKDVTIVELAPSVQVQALASGQIDALLALEPIPTIAINKVGAKIWIADPTVKYIADPSWLGAGIVNMQFAQKNPNTTKKVMEIMGRAADEINKNSDQYRQYLKGYTPLTDDIISKVPIVSFKTCDQFTGQDKNSIQKFFDIFTSHKVVDGKIGVETLLFCK